MENETLFPEETTSEKKNSPKTWLILLVLGVLLGIGIKTEAVKRITIGFNDNQLGETGKNYDLNQLQRQVLEKQVAQENSAPAANNLDQGAACAQ